MLVTSLYSVALRVGANRILPAGRFHHPLGDPGQTPESERRWRRQAVEAALRTLMRPVERPTVFQIGEMVKG